MDFVFRLSIDFVDSLRTTSKTREKKKTKKQSCIEFKPKIHSENEIKIFFRTEITFLAAMTASKNRTANSISFANLHVPMLDEVMVRVLVKLSYYSVNQSAKTHSNDELTYFDY